MNMIEQALQTVRDTGQRFAAVPAITAAPEFDRAFMRAESYLAIGEERRPGARSRFRSFLRIIHPPVFAPTVLVEMVDGRPRVRFMDGMHRYCVFRDAGATRIQVFTTEHMRRLGCKHGLFEQENAE